MDDPQALSLGSRLLLAWACFFRVLLDGRYAARVNRLESAPALTPAPASASASAPASAPASASVPAPASASVPAPASASDITAALQLLSLLQREGRLVDFLQQDIAAFPDADIGAAARVVHQGCRKALAAHATVEPVRPEAEGARVTLAAGFAPDEIKLVGEVKGEPPYTGALRHRGWRVTRLELPKVVGTHDARVLAPAELELS